MMRTAPNPAPREEARKDRLSEIVACATGESDSATIKAAIRVACRLKRLSRFKFESRRNPKSWIDAAVLMAERTGRDAGAVAISCGFGEPLARTIDKIHHNIAYIIRSPHIANVTVACHNNCVSVVTRGRSNDTMGRYAR